MYSKSLQFIEFSSESFFGNMHFQRNKIKSNNITYINILKTIEHNPERASIQFVCILFCINLNRITAYVSFFLKRHVPFVLFLLFCFCFEWKLFFFSAQNWSFVMGFDDDTLAIFTIFAIMNSIYSSTI